MKDFEYSDWISIMYLKKKRKEKVTNLIMSRWRSLFFFFFGLSIDLLKEQTKIQRQHPPTKHEHFWQTKSLDMDKPND